MTTIHFRAGQKIRWAIIAASVFLTTVWRDEEPSIPAPYGMGRAGVRRAWFVAKVIADVLYPRAFPTPGRAK
jgi:hypothetical protein